MNCKIRILATKEIVYANKQFDIKERKCHYYKSDDLDEEFEKGTFEEIIPTPFELFGIECGKGWHDLLLPIFSYIDEYNQDKDEDNKLIPFQIKEKFGGLRVYMNFYTDELNKLIKEAEDEAYKTCELCGSKENVGMTCEGWLTTECHECMKKWCVEHERPHRWKSNSNNKIYWIYPNKEDELFEK